MLCNFSQASNNHGPILGRVWDFLQLNFDIVITQENKTHEYTKINEKITKQPHEYIDNDIYKAKGTTIPTANFIRGSKNLAKIGSKLGPIVFAKAGRRSDTASMSTSSWSTSPSSASQSDSTC